MSESLAAYARDPEAAAIARRRALADRLMQQATQQDFRSPLSVGATVAQSLAGALTGYQADRDLEQRTTRQRDESQAFLGQITGLLGGAEGAAAMGGGAAPPRPAPMPAAPAGAAPASAPRTAPAELLPFYQEASQATGIPVDILIAQHAQESNFNPRARGRAGEIGLGQVLPSTARQPGFGVDPIDPARLDDPRENILWSSRYFGARGRSAGVTDWNDPAQVDRALRAYNGGGDPNYVQNVRRWLPNGQPNPQAGGDVIQASAGAPPAPGGQMPTAGGQAPGAPDRTADIRRLTLAALASDNPQIARFAPFLAQMGQRDSSVRTAAPGSAILNAQGQVIGMVPDRSERAQPPSGYRFGANGSLEAIPGGPADPARSGGPFSGNGMDAQANNIALTLSPRIRNGTASPEEQATYQRAYAHLAGGTIQYVNDPADPSGMRQIAVRVPRDMGDLPPPGGGGGVAPQQAPAAAPNTVPANASGGNDAAAAPSLPNAVPGLERVASPPPGFRRAADGTMLEAIPGGPQDQTRQPLTETAARSNMFGQAMQNGEEILSRVRVPSNSALLAWRNAPESAVNMVLSENDQQYFNALRQFAAGILRKETGAAFTAQELLDVQSRFFPMPGDSPATQAQKAQARRTALEAMRAEVPGGFRGAQSAGPGGQGTAEPPPRVIQYDQRGRRVQ